MPASNLEFYVVVVAVLIALATFIYLAWETIEYHGIKGTPIRINRLLSTTLVVVGVILFRLIFF